MTRLAKSTQPPTGTVQARDRCSGTQRASRSAACADREDAGQRPQRAQLGEAERQRGHAAEQHQGQPDDQRLLVRGAGDRVEGWGPNV